MNIKVHIEEDIRNKRAVFLFTGDKESALLMKYLTDTNVRFVFIDTGYHFYEIIDFNKSMSGKIGIIRNGNVSINYSDSMAECCKQRKTEALKKYLNDVKAGCLIVPFRDEDKDSGIEDSYLKGIEDIEIIRPLADLTERDVWIKIREYSLPYSRIYNKGYRLVDCKCCTTRHGRKKQGEDSESRDLDDETKDKLMSLGYM